MTGRKFFVITSEICFFLFFLVNYSNASDKPSDIPGWKLVWNDEFDGNSIDTSKWKIEEAALEKNNEQQYYTAEDVYLEKGCLVLRSQKRSKGARRYTSGLVETKGKYSQMYGRFEIRARFPYGPGIWPALWMLSTSGLWPPEIDIAETMGGKQLYMTVHYSRGNQPHLLDGSDVEIPGLTDDFHVFVVEWEPDSIRWYVDGKLYRSAKDNIPHEPFYLIMNTAVGGIWPGYPDKTTRFPQYHLIDYVRIYQADKKGVQYLTTQTENGIVTTDPEGTRFNTNSGVTLTAKPITGFKFSKWKGDIESLDNPLPLVMNKNYNIQAVFEEDPLFPPRISEGKPITASSNQNTYFVATKAVDGDIKTRWSSKFFDPQWITIDLEDTYHIHFIRLLWESAYGNAFSLQVSQDNQRWKTIEEVKNNRNMVSEFIFNDVIARYVRLYGTKRAGNWGYSLWEFQVYGQPEKMVINSDVKVK